jgi:hypothetical protein
MQLGSSFALLCCLCTDTKYLGLYWPPGGDEQSNLGAAVQIAIRNQLNYMI